MLGIFFLTALPGQTEAMAGQSEYTTGTYSGTVKTTAVGFIYDADNGVLNLTGGSVGDDTGIYNMQRDRGAVFSDGTEDDQFFYKIAGQIKELKITGDLVIPNSSYCPYSLAGIAYKFVSMEKISGLSHLKKGPFSQIDIMLMYFNCQSMKKADFTEINLADVYRWENCLLGASSVDEIIIGNQDISHIAGPMWTEDGPAGIDPYFSKLKNGEVTYFENHTAIKYLGIQDDGMRHYDGTKKDGGIEHITDCDYQKKIPGTGINLVVCGDLLTVTGGRGESLRNLLSYLSGYEDAASKISRINITGDVTAENEIDTMFSGFTNITEIKGLNKVKCTADAYSLSEFTKDCQNLKLVDLSGFDLSKASDWTAAFQGMDSLIEINIGDNDLPAAFKELDPFNGKAPDAFKKLINEYDSLYDVLARYKKITLVDTSETDYVFELTTVDGEVDTIRLPRDTTVKVTLSEDTMSLSKGFVEEDKAPLQVKTMVEKNTSESGEAAEKMKPMKKVALTGEITEDKDNKGHKNFYGMFKCGPRGENGSDPSGLTYVESIENLSNLTLKNEEDLGEMFAGMQSLKSIDLSEIDMSKVTGADDMFRGCSSLIEIKTGGQKFPEGSDPMPVEDENGSPLIPLVKAEGSLNSLLEKYDSVRFSGLNNEDGSYTFTGTKSDGTSETLKVDKNGKYIEEEVPEENPEEEQEKEPEEKSEGDKEKESEEKIEESSDEKTADDKKSEDETGGNSGSGNSSGSSQNSTSGSSGASGNSQTSGSGSSQTSGSNSSGSGTPQVTVIVNPENTDGKNDETSGRKDTVEQKNDTSGSKTSDDKKAEYTKLENDIEENKTDSEKPEYDPIEVIEETAEESEDSEEDDNEADDDKKSVAAAGPDTSNGSASSDKKAAAAVTVTDASASSVAAAVSTYTAASVSGTSHSVWPKTNDDSSRWPMAGGLAFIMAGAAVLFIRKRRCA